MNRSLFAALLLATLLTGCTRRYLITLTNGRQITAAGKPQLQGNSFVFTDAQGQPGSVPASRVREVAPTSSASSGFNSGHQDAPSK